MNGWQSSSLNRSKETDAIEAVWGEVCPQPQYSVFDNLSPEERFIVFCVGNDYLLELKRPLNKRLAKIELEDKKAKLVQKKRRAFFEQGITSEIDRYLFVDSAKKNLPEKVLAILRTLSREMYLSSGKTEEDYLMYLEYLNNLE